MLPAGWSLRPLPGVWKAIFSPCPDAAVPPRACVLIPSSYRDTRHTGLGPTLPTSLYLNRPHIQSHPEGRRGQDFTYRFWGDTTQPTTPPEKLNGGAWRDCRVKCHHPPPTECDHLGQGTGPSSFLITETPGWPETMSVHTLGVRNSALP